MADPRTLSDILADAKIKLKSQRPGHTEQVLCPHCDGGRTRELSLSVTIDADGMGAVWTCHRGSCGWKSGGRAGGADRPIERERPIVKPRPASLSETENRPQWFWDFWAERKIGMRTVEAFGAYVTHRNSPTLGQNHPYIVFPYTFNAELVNRKYRPFPEKQPQMQDRDALQTLFNVDRLGTEPEEIVWVEGEPDVMALFECGIPHAVSLKDGAPAKLSDNPSPTDKRFEALRTHSDLLKKAPRVVLAGDNDEPGKILREELARRLGRHKCRIVEWPEGCKDACDVLRQHGPEMVVGCIDAAQPYPIEGLQRIKPGMLRELRRRPRPAVMTTGVSSTDDMPLRLPTEGAVIVVTGWPGSGKTAWVRYAMIHTMKNYARRWGVFSPEMNPWQQFVVSCAEPLIGRPFYPELGYSHMSEDEVSQAEAWLGQRLTMLVCDAEDESPTMDWVFEHARLAVLRDGITDLLVDPFNEMDHTRAAGVTETEHIGRFLQRARAFGLRHGCNFWIIAHPAKPMGVKPGEKPAVPTAFQISGSAHWFNKADLGLTIHRPDLGISEAHLWKSRHRRWGQHPNSAIMNYDPVIGVYSAPSDNFPPPAVMWNDPQ